MSTYADSGVDIEAGDASSKIAYEAAKLTFPGRQGRMAEAAVLEGGFSGALDMGDFYLVQNDDGVGSKMMIAQALGKWDTVGYDLVAMVADDAICVGAEVVSLTNTVDIEKVDAAVIEPMMKGLSEACLQEKIVVPGGEIAELPGQVKGVIWNATAVGIVEKDKFIDGSKIVAGDVVLGVRSAGFRSNGFSLIRHILQKEFGDDWVHADYGDGRSWGEVVLEPSLIYHHAALDILGRYGEKRQLEIHGLVHVTGGGLKANTARVLPDGLSVDFDNLWEPHEAMLKLMEIGGVSEEEAGNTWNMGTGLLVILPKADADVALQNFHGFEVRQVGVVSN